MKKKKNLEQAQINNIFLKKWYIIYILILIKLYLFIQLKPQSQSEEIYYGKDSGYDKDVKNKIDRTSSLIRNGVREYSNGNVDVIVPCV